MILLQHLLVFFLIVVTPLWDWFEIPRLKASTAPRKKIRFFRKIILASWICAFVAMLTAGFDSVFWIRADSGEISWLRPDGPGRMALLGVMAGMLGAIFVPAILALVSGKIRAKAAKSARRLSFILPSTQEERGWWWLVCVTAGICEEIVYRGFLLHYLHVLPFHLGLTRALVVAAVIFGIAHLYQGVAGGISTAVIGFVFGGLFLVTGSLLIPMVIHAVMDLRVLAMLPVGFETAPE